MNKLFKMKGCRDENAVTVAVINGHQSGEIYDQKVVWMPEKLSPGKSVRLPVSTLGPLGAISCG